MLRHIGFVEKADKLRKAVDGAAADPSLNMSGTKEGNSTVEFADSVLKLM